MLLGLDAILTGQIVEMPNGVQPYPRALEHRVARALAHGVRVRATRGAC